MRADEMRHIESMTANGLRHQESMNALDVMNSSQKNEIEQLRINEVELKKEIYKLKTELEIARQNN